MILNRLEYALMNNPVRAAVQRHIEAKKLLRMGGEVKGGYVLEIGCGQGVGIEIIRDVFGASRVDGFDLDQRMVDRARSRWRDKENIVRIWCGDAVDIQAEDEQYDAVFDFGILHHVPEWRKAVSEIFRVLKPGGRFYAEEVLAKVIMSKPGIWLFDHPRQDRFDDPEFEIELQNAGFAVIETYSLLSLMSAFVARKPLES